MLWKDSIFQCFIFLNVLDYIATLFFLFSAWVEVRTVEKDYLQNKKLEITKKERKIFKKKPVEDAVIEEVKAIKKKSKSKISQAVNEKLLEETIEIVSCLYISFL